MQIVDPVRFAGLVVLLWLLSSCAPNQPTPLPTASQQPVNVVVPLPAVLAEPQRWSGQQITLVAPVYDDGEDRLLTVPATTNASEVDPANAIWLAQALPANVRQQLSPENSIVKLRGTLSPPGAYGREQRFAYQFVTDQAGLISPERTTIANLALNPQALDQILLRLEGTLLADANGALLVDEVGKGGVPRANGYQIKLARATLDPVLLAALNQAGNVRWGQVQIVGWWQNGTLTPLSANRLGTPDSPDEQATAAPSAEP